MRPGLDASRSAYFPLRDAILCIDCEFITPAANGKCSICGSNRLVPLVELLGLLLEQACGAKAPVSLAELAGALAWNNSTPRSSSHNRNQVENRRFELLRYFETFVKEDHSCSPPSRTKPAPKPVSARNMTVSLLPRPRKRTGS